MTVAVPAADDSTNDLLDCWNVDESILVRLTVMIGTASCTRGSLIALTKSTSSDYLLHFHSEFVHKY